MHVNDFKIVTDVNNVSLKYCDVIESRPSRPYHVVIDLIKYTHVVHFQGRYMKSVHLSIVEICMNKMSVPRRFKFALYYLCLCCIVFRPKNLAKPNDGIYISVCLQLARILSHTHAHIHKHTNTHTHTHTHRNTQWDFHIKQFLKLHDNISPIVSVPRGIAKLVPRQISPFLFARQMVV